MATPKRGLWSALTTVGKDRLKKKGVTPQSYNAYNKLSAKEKRIERELAKSAGLSHPSLSRTKSGKDAIKSLPTRTVQAIKEGKSAATTVVKTDAIKRQTVATKLADLHTSRRGYDPSVNLGIIRRVNTFDEPTLDDTYVFVTTHSPDDIARKASETPSPGQSNSLWYH